MVKSSTKSVVIFVCLAFCSKQRLYSILFRRNMKAEEFSNFCHDLRNNFNIGNSDPNEMKKRSPSFHKLRSRKHVNSIMKFWNGKYCKLQLWETKNTKTHLNANIWRGNTNFSLSIELEIPQYLNYEIVRSNKRIAGNDRKWMNWNSSNTRALYSSDTALTTSFRFNVFRSFQLRA